MLKLRKDGVEYEVLGHITFKLNEEDETTQTNYTIVIDGETITVSSTDTEYEVFIAPDPVIEPEVVPEPEPVVEPEPEVIPEPTPEELAAQEEARIAMEAEQVFQTAKSEWLQKKQALTTMIDDMERGSKLGITPDETQVAIMTELAQWVNTNMDRRYYF